MDVFKKGVPYEVTDVSSIPDDVITTNDVTAPTEEHIKEAFASEENLSKEKVENTTPFETISMPEAEDISISEQEQKTDTVSLQDVLKTAAIELNVPSVEQKSLPPKKERKYIRPASYDEICLFTIFFAVCGLPLGMFQMLFAGN